VHFGAAYCPGAAQWQARRCAFYCPRFRPWRGGETDRKNGVEQHGRFFERYGKHTILVCRLLPFVPFDPVSYAAGLTSIRFRHFFIATGIGQLPATIVYSWAGSLLTGGTFWFVTGLFILFALSVIISVARSLYLEHQRKKT
jgi:uncharacterized membrane protein YdjX (TVP38/TMEM64 family)